MALELRPNCECCDRDLPPASTIARICSYECTFCADCVDNVLFNVCPNCGGGFVPRPIRPATEWQPGLSVALWFNHAVSPLGARAGGSASCQDQHRSRLLLPCWWAELRSRRKTPEGARRVGQSFLIPPSTRPRRAQPYQTLTIACPTPIMVIPIRCKACSTSMLCRL